MERMQLLSDLLFAYYDARKNKRNTINQLKFEKDFEHEIFCLCDEIQKRTYTLRPSICFIVNEPVKREVFAADFRDRVIHHLIFNYINEVLELSFINDSYSCRKGRGTTYGIKRVEDFITCCSENYTRDCYILKLDIKGYFMNINKNILLRQLSLLLTPEKRDAAYGGLWSPDPPDWDMVNYLVDLVIKHDPREHCHVKGPRSEWNGLPGSKSLFHCQPDCGLPIGNLTSQLFSNVYMHPFDRYMTEDLGLCYYGRYVDDFVVVGNDRTYLREVIRLADRFLKRELHLELHPNKIYLQHYAKGVKFLGAVIKPGRTVSASRTRKNMVRCLRKWDSSLSVKVPDREDLLHLRSSVNSYLGILQQFKSWRFLYNAIRKKGHAFFQYGYFTGKFQKFCVKKKLLEVKKTKH
jgi:hypothetical protein